jgi:hypothetical protein
VVVDGGRAFVFYAVHPNRIPGGPYVPISERANIAYRQSVIQVAGMVCHPLKNNEKLEDSLVLYFLLAYLLLFLCFFFFFLLINPATQFFILAVTSTLPFLTILTLTSPSTSTSTSTLFQGG